MESDILLVGWQEREELIKPRLDANKFTIRMSERLYREGQYKAVSPRGLMRKYREHTKYRNGNVYLLCYGAYVPSDFHIVRAYPNKMYRFGYFPETKIFDKSRNLYGLNFARASRKDNMIICEGYMDVIALHQAGFTQAVASLGTALTENQCRLIARYTKKVLLNKPIPSFINLA